MLSTDLPESSIFIEILTRTDQLQARLPHLKYPGLKREKVNSLSNACESLKTCIGSLEAANMVLFIAHGFPRIWIELEHLLAKNVFPTSL
ncbi:hypothetical protein RRG08_020048 [Elysia crispata]|uniref:Uncharacterized protein n=1 Tax=Elysia crispata TaxID=231223 RepID=A0AAE1CU67_9GAST|nr:hypothetical protein RRG08_020048 [Elysia crispata]